MSLGAYNSTTAILRLLIDAGGDVNRRDSDGEPPLFPAIYCENVDDSEDKVHMLLTQPSLDVSIKFEGRTAKQHAYYHDRPHLAEMIAHEVSGKVGWAACGHMFCVDRVWCCCG